MYTTATQLEIWRILSAAEEQSLSIFVWNGFYMYWLLLYPGRGSSRDRYNIHVADHFRDKYNKFRMITAS